MNKIIYKKINKSQRKTNLPTQLAFKLKGARCMGLRYPCFG